MAQTIHEVAHNWLAAQIRGSSRSSNNRLSVHVNTFYLAHVSRPASISLYAFPSTLFPYAPSFHCQRTGTKEKETVKKLERTARWKDFLLLFHAPPKNAPLMKAWILHRLKQSDLIWCWIAYIYLSTAFISPACTVTSIVQRCNTTFLRSLY